MQIKAFRALRPRPETAADVACAPYDTMDTAEAAAVAAGSPLSFVRVVRPEINLPEADPYAPEVYAEGAARLRALERDGALVREDGPALYVYRLEKGGHRQTGVMGCCAVADYRDGVIRRHELTRPEKLNDRIRLIRATRAHTEPVLLTYGDSAKADAIMAAITATAPLFAFGAPDGVRHTFWRAARPEPLLAALAAVPCAYIADGHHRAAAAAAEAQADGAADGAGGPEDGWFMAALFPAGQLRILSYNRCVSGFNGLTPDRFLAAVRERFTLEPAAPPSPRAPGRISMYMGGAWRGLTWRGRAWATGAAADDPVAALDVSVLQDRLLGPVLGVRDPTRDARISFVDGARGPEDLARRVDAGEAVAAFAMHPVTVAQMMAVADAGRLMPPKSTWFDPKPCSGLAVHTLDA